MHRWFPARVDPADPARPMYLHSAVREVPVVAVGAAVREALRLVDVLEAMLLSARGAFEKGDRRQIAETKRMDDVLDKLNTAIKSYLGSLDAAAMTETDHQRVEEVLIFAHNLEHAGDIVEKNLMGLASKRLKRGPPSSEEDQAKLTRMMDRPVTNLHAAASVFMTDDLRAARLLAAEKEAFRNIEESATQAHFDRLRTGRGGLAEASALHLDALRELRQVNAHLVAAAAYPVLKNQGGLLPSGLTLEE